MGLQVISKRLTTVAAAACMGLMSLGGTAALYAQASYTTTLPALDVTIGVDKTSITVGEPVVLTVAMENVSAAPFVDVSASLQFPEGNGIDLRVQPPGEIDYQYAGALELGSYPARPMRIVRGVPQTVQMILLYDRTQPNGFLFSKPGVYGLSGEVRLHINNNPMPEVALIPQMQMTVTAPEGAEAEILALVDEPQLVQALHLGVAPTTAILETLEPVGRKYPQTPLGALALRGVGQQLSLADVGQREKGAAILQEYLANGLVLADGEYSAWCIAVAYHFTAKYDLAREWIYYAMRHYPRSSRIRPEDPLYKYYFFDPADFARQVPWYLLKEPWSIPGAKPPEDLKAVQPGQ